MSEPSRRRRLEELLAGNPEDSFLRYGLALEVLKEDAGQGIACLKELVEADPDYQAAYFQLGQNLARQGASEEAALWLRQGIEAANRVGNDHAAGEMSEFLQSL